MARPCTGRTVVEQAEREEGAQPELRRRACVEAQAAAGAVSGDAGGGERIGLTGVGGAEVCSPAAE
jgi:hypothetical protein